MGAKVNVVLGAAGSGKTYELICRYLARSTGGGGRGGNSIGSRLWLAPTARAATPIREALLSKGGACLAPGVTTFDGLSRRVLSLAGLRRHVIAPAMQRELLRRIVAAACEQGRLAFYREGAQRTSFVELLAAHFAELRQRDISPQAYERTVRNGKNAQQVELAQLFVDYDRLLTAHHLCDGAGIHAIARDALERNGRDLFGELDLVVFDGFTDFTRIEQQILLQLAHRARQVAVSLVVDATRSRNDLFAKTAATLAKLKRCFSDLEEVVLPPRPTTNWAIAHVGDQVFRHPHPVPSAEVLAALPSIKIVAAAGVHDEIVQVARRVKQLLTEPKCPPGQGQVKHPVTPEDVMVVFRSVGEIAPRIDEVFQRYGIPYAIEARPRIARSAHYRTLRNLLRLDLEDWPFRRLVGVITNRLLSTVDEPARRAADWLIRDLQIANGRQQLLETVAALAAQNERLSELSEHQQRRVAAAVLALPVLQCIGQALDRLPQRAPLVEWGESLRTLLVELEIVPKNESDSSQRSSTQSPVGANDRVESSVGFAVLDSIARHLVSLQRLDVWFGEPPREWNRRQMQVLLADIGTKESLPREHDEVGRVRVLSAQSARTESVRHLFLAGMSEQAFPASIPTGRLASENDYHFLTAAAHPKESTKRRNKVSTPAVSTHAQDEMLLFYEVISRARETLTISFPAMDDKAQELPPSPYVVELQRIFRNGEQQISRTPPQLSPVPHVAASLRDADSPATGAVFSLADWRITATAAAATTDGDRRLLAGLLSQDATKPLALAIDSGIRTVHARARGETFGPFEGVLVSPAVTKRLNERFGKRHTWSPSQFETYAACPYKFFLNTVLGLEPIGDLVLETDFARRGSLVHHVLAVFHRKFSESPSEWLAISRDETRFEAEIKLALQSAFAGVPQTGIEAALAELDRRQIDKWTDAYHDQYDKYDRAWTSLDEPPRPTHFELRFGRKHTGDDGYEDPNSVDNSFQLDIGGEKIHVAGRIDRIDVGRAGGRTVFNVIDYKSGIRPTLTSEKIESGERLQPALYVMAAQALIFGDEQATPLWAGYWSLKNGVTTRKGFSLHCSVESGELTREWKDLQPKVIARIAEIVRSARRGDFPVNSSDVNCTSRCDFKTVCRVGQVRSVGKVWSPPSGDA